MVTQALNSPHGAALDPGVADTLAQQRGRSAKRQEDLGHPACLLVPDLIRAPMARLLKRAAPRLRVLATAKSLRPIRSASVRSLEEPRHERQTLYRADFARCAEPGPPGARRRRRRAVDQAVRRGVEVLAMAPEGMRQVERRRPCRGSVRRRRRRADCEARAPDAAPSRASTSAGRGRVERLAMSTLSFQDYVRDAHAEAPQGRAADASRRRAAAARERAPRRRRRPPSTRQRARAAVRSRHPPDCCSAWPSAARSHRRRARRASGASAAPTAPMPLRPSRDPCAGAVDAGIAPRRDARRLMQELRSMKGLIEERFGALAFMDSCSASPARPG